jgi:phospholipid/cholesterol/gamma-HCH transport system substrate-binding protein
VKYSKEIKTGFVVVVAVALFIYGYNFLKGRDIFSTSLDLYAEYDHIDGLTANNTVQINGFKVGTVRDVELMPNGKLRVHFIVTDKNLILTDSAIALIKSGGLLGNMELALIASPKGKPVVDNTVIRGLNEIGLKDQVNAQLLPLKNKVESLVGSIDSMVVVFSAVLNEESAEDIKVSFDNIRLALESFRNTAFNLDTMVASSHRSMTEIVINMREFSDMMAENKDTLAMALANFENVSDSLAKSNLKAAIDNAAIALANANLLLTRINAEGANSVLFGQDSLVIADLRRSNAMMSFLIEDIANYPGRYLPFKNKPNKKEEQERQRKLDSINKMRGTGKVPN